MMEMHLNKSSLPPLRKFCFHQCMSVCLLTQDYSKTADQIFVKFSEMVGYNPGTNRVTLSQGWRVPCSLTFYSFYVRISILITAAREVFLSSALVNLFVGLRQSCTQPIFTVFDGKAAHRPRKKPLDFGGNPDHVTLGLLHGTVGYGYRWRTKGQNRFWNNSVQHCGRDSRQKKIKI